MTGAKVEEQAYQLKKVCDEAFDANPHSCSHAVWQVIRHYKPAQTWKNANALIDEISTSDEWQEVSVAELSGLANDGVLVVGGKKEPAHGHVIVVYPGPEKRDGGYYTTSKRTGRKVLVKSTGFYARAISTSMGSWVGAKSRGDKTIYDPWRDKFNGVRFWKYLGRN